MRSIGLTMADIDVLVQLPDPDDGEVEETELVAVHGDEVLGALSRLQGLELARSIQVGVYISQESQETVSVTAWRRTYSGAAFVGAYLYDMASSQIVELNDRSCSI